MPDERAATETIGRMGDLLGNRYELVRPLARGGMAEVWEGLDHTLDRSVAVKMLHAHLAGDAGFFTRFHREAVAAAQLNHPNVVAVYDTGVDTRPDGGRRAYIVMELVRGETLRMLLRRGLGVDDAVNIVGQAAEGLDYAHRNGLVHRDVKPANILVRPDGRVQVADFGIAKAIQGGGPTDHRSPQEDLTQAGSILGTAKYLAPEQVEGRPLDARTDVYALGIVLYELLCGQPPFIGTNDMATALLHVQQEPVAPRQRRAGIPVSLESIVLRALRKNPAERFASAAEFARALRSVDLTPDDAVPQVQRGPADNTPSHGITEADAPTTLRDRTTARPAMPGSSDPTTVAPGGRRAGTPRPQPPPAPTREPTSPARARPTHRRAGVVTALVVALLGGGTGAGAAWLYTDRSPTTGGPTLALTGVDAFDPFGDGHESDTELKFAIDGNTTTTWSTFPGEKHPEGVGLWVSLQQPGRIGAVRIDTDSTSWAAQLYVASTARPTLQAWGKPVASIANGLRGENRVALPNAVQGGYVLVWFTSLGKDERVRVRDVFVEGPA